MEDILASALEAAHIEIKKVDLKKKKSVFLSDLNNPSLTFDDFSEYLSRALKKNQIYKDHQEVFDADVATLSDMVKNHARLRQILVGGERIAPTSLADYQLNLDLESDPPKFFVTTKDEYLSSITGSSYIAVMGMKQDEAVHVARHVAMDYNPRGKSGVYTNKHGREVRNIFNTYVPPLWKGHPNTKGSHGKIHPLFLKCIKHVFPIKKERNFFYAWLYMSIFKRAPTYLLLCGNAGLGKNRIKLLLRALHGHENTPDGKKSSLTERFNSQVERTTLLWFDELNFNEEVENILKEMQNETISIERKGVDATRSTKIYSSMVISNNYPRHNYIQFDSRKFVPLELGTTMLGKSMTHKEIDQLTRMTAFPDSTSFDIAALADFVCWLKRNGPGYAEQFPNLEYKGPMFYRLAHTTMSAWQKCTISFLLSDKIKSAYVTDDKELGVKWSYLEPAVRKTLYKGYNWPHSETIKRFLEIYCSLKGEQGFKITPIEGIEGDFFVKPLIKKLPTQSELEIRAEVEEESDIHLL